MGRGWPVNIRSGISKGHNIFNIKADQGIGRAGITSHHGVDPCPYFIGGSHTHWPTECGRGGNAIYQGQGEKVSGKFPAKISRLISLSSSDLYIDAIWNIMEELHFMNRANTGRLAALTSGSKQSGGYRIFLPGRKYYFLDTPG